MPGATLGRVAGLSLCPSPVQQPGSCSSPAPPAWAPRRRGMRSAPVPPFWSFRPFSDPVFAGAGNEPCFKCSDVFNVDGRGNSGRKSYGSKVSSTRKRLWPELKERGCSWTGSHKGCRGRLNFVSLRVAPFSGVGTTRVRSEQPGCLSAWRVWQTPPKASFSSSPRCPTCPNLTPCEDCGRGESAFCFPSGYSP